MSQKKNSEKKFFFSLLFYPTHCDLDYSGRSNFFFSHGIPCFLMQETPLFPLAVISDAIQIHSPDLHPKEKQKRPPRPRLKKEPRNTPQRFRTKQFIRERKIHHDLPIWLLDCAVQFDSNNPLYFQQIVQPALEKRRSEYGWPNYQKFKKRIAALKSFILNHFTDFILHPQIYEKIHFFEQLIPTGTTTTLTTTKTSNLTEQETTFLFEIKQRLTPQKLSQFQRYTQRNMHRYVHNRVALDFIQWNLFKDSYKNIVLQ